MDEQMLLIVVPLLLSLLAVVVYLVKAVHLKRKGHQHGVGYVKSFPDEDLDLRVLIAIHRMYKQKATYEHTIDGMLDEWLRRRQSSIEKYFGIEKPQDVKGE